MRRILLMAALVIVAVACIKIGTGNATPRLAPVLGAVWAPGDSVRISGHWTAVTDARGDAVQYEWALRRDGAVAASGTTAELAVQRTFAAPLAGDTTAYQLVVVAVDTRGYRSTEGSSAVLVVRGPWTAPPAPEVGVDTVPGELAAEFDSLNIYFISYATLQRVDADSLRLWVGDSIQACVEGWKDGAVVGLEGQVQLCGGPAPYFEEVPLEQQLELANFLRVALR